MQTATEAAARRWRVQLTGTDGIERFHYSATVNAPTREDAIADAKEQFAGGCGGVKYASMTVTGGALTVDDQPGVREWECEWR